MTWYDSLVLCCSAYYSVLLCSLKVLNGTFALVLICCTLAAALTAYGDGFNCICLDPPV